MKPIRFDVFQEQLDNEFAWRQTELTFLERNIQKSGPDKDKIKANSRAGIVLLYAHWEGFVKSAAELYLKFVASKKLRHDELGDFFIALSLKKKFGELLKRGKSDGYIKVVNFMLHQLSEPAIIPYEKEIKTQWNLTFEVLREILNVIGLPYSSYELSKERIDCLVTVRNDIAHGQQKEVYKNQTEILFKEIIQMIRDIKTDILNAAAQESYRKRKTYEPDNI